MAAEQQSRRVLSFRRVEYTCTPAAFWSSVIRDPAADPSRNFKAHIQMGRAEVPEEVRSTVTTAEQMEAAGAAAARLSFEAFFSCVETVMSTPIISQSVAIVEMKHVGLKCEGRGGLHDLLYIVHTGECYAADSMDDSIVYRMC